MIMGRVLRVCLTTALAGSFLTAGCGVIGDGPHDERPLQIRFLAQGAPLEWQDSGGGQPVVRINDSLQVYSALMRIERLRIDDHDSDAALDIDAGANVDLFTTTVLKEVTIPYERIRSVAIAVETGSGGEGVLFDEAIAVYIGGIMQDEVMGQSHPFEARFRSLGWLEMDAELPNGRDGVLTIQFDLGQWLGDLDPEELEFVDGHYRIDEDHNSETSDALVEDAEDHLMASKEEWEDPEHDLESDGGDSDGFDDSPDGDPPPP